MILVLILGANGQPKVPHDLRRSAARRMEQAGLPRSISRRLIGLKTESDELVEGLPRHRLARAKTDRSGTIIMTMTSQGRRASLPATLPPGTPQQGRAAGHGSAEAPQGGDYKLS